MKIRPAIEFHGIKRFFKKDLLTVRKYKWEDPLVESSSPVIIKRSIEFGGISIVFWYRN